MNPKSPTDLLVEVWPVVLNEAEHHHAMHGDALHSAEDLAHESVPKLLHDLARYNPARGSLTCLARISTRASCKTKSRIGPLAVRWATLKTPHRSNGLRTAATHRLVVHALASGIPMDAQSDEHSDHPEESRWNSIADPLAETPPEIISTQESRQLAIEVIDDAIRSMTEIEALVCHCVINGMCVNEMEVALDGRANGKSIRRLVDNAWQRVRGKIRLAGERRGLVVTQARTFAALESLTDGHHKGGRLNYARRREAENKSAR